MAETYRIIEKERFVIGYVMTERSAGESVTDMQNTLYTKRIRIFTSVYAAVAVFAVAMLIYTIITIQRVNLP